MYSAPQNSGFTLIEVLLTVTVISVVTTFVFAGFSSISKTQRLKDIQENFKTEMRYLQNQAVSGVKPAGCVGNLDGYYFTLGVTGPVSETSTSGGLVQVVCGGVTTRLGINYIFKGVPINSITINGSNISAAKIKFSPSGSIEFYDSSNNKLTGDPMYIEFGDSSVNVRVYLNSSGMIYSSSSTQSLAGGGSSSSGIGSTAPVTLGGGGTPTTGTPGFGTNNLPITYNPKVLLVIYNPIIESQGNIKLTQYAGWNNPDTITQSFMNDVSSVSRSLVNYNIASRVEIDGYPIKSDGFQYTDQTYLDCMNSGGSRCHNPDLADYRSIISQTDACGKLNRGEIDELWLWGGPWFGYWESNLAGPNAFWYNSSPTTGTSCNKMLPIMGFSYQVGEDNMFHDVGHRLESTMTRVYGSWNSSPITSWDKFSLLDYQSVNNGGCGNTHKPVNTSPGNDYDYSNSRSVSSKCSDFANYPNLTNTTVLVSCTNWGCNQLGYFKWFFGFLPRFGGTGPDGKLNNWWAYLVSPNTTIQ